MRVRGRSLVTSACCAAVLAAAGCSEAEPRPQWLVTISTDAPVPQFGDRVFVEVLHADGTSCSSCNRLFGLDSGADLPLSFGVSAPESGGEGLRVRARLFRSARTGADGLPEDAGVIDAVGELPERGDEAIIAGSLHLRTRCFGVAADPPSRRTCIDGALAPEPVLAEVPPLATGSWPPAQPVACPAEPQPDMVCVPGGAFLLGGFPYPQIIPGAEPLPERPIQVAPFALDRTEVTVGRVRELFNQGRIGSEPVTGFSELEQAFCTYEGKDVLEADALPVNCVSHSFATEVCTALGKRLPTEVEWEWAAGNLAKESTYPWGEATDFCARTIVGRGPFPWEYPGAGMVGGSSECRQVSADVPIPHGPTSVGSSADVTELGIFDLGGNLTEWTSELFAPYSDPCWTTVDGVLVGACTQPLGDTLRVLRGASWAERPSQTRGYVRFSLGEARVGLQVGFRCAVSL